MDKSTKKQTKSMPHTLLYTYRINTPRLARLFQFLNLWSLSNCNFWMECYVNTLTAQQLNEALEKKKYEMTVFWKALFVLQRLAVDCNFCSFSGIWNERLICLLILFCFGERQWRTDGWLSICAFVVITVSNWLKSTSCLQLLTWRIGDCSHAVQHQQQALHTKWCEILD